MTSAELSAPESCFSFLVLMQTMNVWQWGDNGMLLSSSSLTSHHTITTTTIIIVIIDGYDYDLRSWS